MSEQAVSSGVSAIEEFTARTIDQVARFFRVNRRTVSEWKGRGCPGGRGAYSLPDIVQWLREHIWSDGGNGKPLQGFEGDDDDLQGFDSPGLERYRLAKAEITELDLAAKKKQMVSRDSIGDGLVRCSGVLRGALENLQRQFGPEALAIMDDALAEYDRIVHEEFGDRGDEEPDS